MRIEYTGLSEIKGSLITLEGVRGVSYDEMAQISTPDGRRRGRVVLIDGDRVVVEVFEGTAGIDMKTACTQFTGKPMTLPLSDEILGRVFDGTGRPADGLSEIYAEEHRDVNGAAINPVSREYPKSCILTGVSAIDATCTLIRGQKLPIFSGAGMSHNELAAQIVRQARVLSSQKERFVIVFCAMGIKNDTAEFFRRDLTESGALGRTVMYLNLASDPIIERILAPRCAMTAAEYLAFGEGYHVLVVMTDMTFYCEALREFSSSKGEIPSRKGFPSYMYSDLASIYERAGVIRGKPGSITLMPLLTMPGDDISHPIPDLTGYITEGQIILSRDLAQKGIYPPVSILPSLSRLMKDGTGEGFTREDHHDLSNQLFASYSEVAGARSLATVIGEDELSPTDKLYLKFGKEFELRFINQGAYEDRSLEETLNLGWELLSILPRPALTRLSDEMLDKHYRVVIKL